LKDRDEQFALPGNEQAPVGEEKKEGEKPVKKPPKITVEEKKMDEDDMP